MRTQLTTTFFLLIASTPAGASINATEATPLGMDLQLAAFAGEPVAQADPACGEAREMLYILRDPSGAIVAMGVAEVTPDC
jgi:hypothetical protein